MYATATWEESTRSPKNSILWIGCSDSRVPESVLLGCKPGDIFVTRNIANQVHLSDDSIISVLAYAIAAVGVEHVIIAGHSNCGGANHCLAASANYPPSGEAPASALGRWLDPLTSVAAQLQQEKEGKLTSLELVEENVRIAVKNVLASEPVKNAWSNDANARGQAKLLGVHGWVYDLENGRVRDLGISVTV
ncbi:carbonic anhydrase [Trametopsis cervina]|nr:carbonic anhydrase [Trametopsis cervina]